MLVCNLGKASDDAGSLQRPCEAIASIDAPVAPVWRHRFDAQRAAFEYGLQPVDAAIALSQTLASAEAVGRAIAHAQGPAAVQAAWRVVNQPQFFGPPAALRAAEIGP